MDSGPVATFQVHEYLRPRVSSAIRSLYKYNNLCELYDSYQPNLTVLSFNVTSYVIYMRMIQYLTSSNAV